MLWAIYFIRTKIIEVGRLQYEYTINEDNRTIVKIHIPRGDKLDILAVKKSIIDSKIQLKKIFNISNCEYMCDSWLLSNQIHELVDKGSNIYKFYELFEVVEGEECLNDILNFVFEKNGISDYSQLSEETSLQAKIKDYLMRNNKIKIGQGKLRREQEYGERFDNWK